MSLLWAAIWTYGSRMMLESFIDGREITVSVMGDKALGVTEIRPYEGFYDYEAKYTDGRAEHLIPAPIHPDAIPAAMDYALRCAQGTGVPRQFLRRFHVRRSCRRAGRSVPSRSQHSARHDAAVAVPEQAPTPVSNSASLFAGWWRTHYAMDKSQAG